MKAKVLKCSTAEFWRDKSYAERGTPEILRVSFTYSAREKLLEARKKTIWKEQREQSRELIQGLEKLVFLQSKKPHILWVIGYALVARYCFRSRGNSPRLVLLYFQIINFKSIPRKKSKLLSSVQSSCSVVSNSLRLHELQHAGPPCPLPSPRVHPNTCPSSRWCHPTISPSVVCFSSCPQSFPASGSFPMSQLFSSGGKSIGVSASTSVNTQDWSPLGWTGWIPLQSKGLSRVFSNTTVQKHQFFSAQLSL